MRVVKNDKMDWNQTALETFDWDCYLTLDEFFEYFEHQGITNVLKLSNFISILHGPVLWTICFLGLVLNVIVIIPDLIVTFSVTSIFTSSASIILTFKSLILLFQWDFYQGRFCLYCWFAIKVLDQTYKYLAYFFSHILNILHHLSTM